MERNIKKWGIICALLFLVFVRIPKIFYRYSRSEVKEYLNDKYPDTKFKIRGSEITTQEPFEVTFQIGRHMEGDLYDDYRQQVVKIIANQLGMPCEVVTYSYGSQLLRRYGAKVIVYYPDYRSIESASEQFIQLVQECRNYDLLRLRGPELTISPDTGNSYFPGYGVAIAEPKRGEEDSLADLVRQLKYNYIYVIGNYSAIEDEDIATGDIIAYQRIYVGTVVRAADGTTKRLPRVNMRRANGMSGNLVLDFGGAYQVLKSQGAEITTEQNRFTATINGKTITFSCDYSAVKPKYSYEYLAGEKESGVNRSSISVSLIEDLTGKKIESGGESIWMPLY